MQATHRHPAPTPVRKASRYLILAGLLVTASSGALAETGDEAKAILKAMSDYMGSQQAIELTFDSDIEVITPELEKLQFTNSGEVLLNRPDKLRAHRKGGGDSRRARTSPIAFGSSPPNQGQTSAQTHSAPSTTTPARSRRSLMA